MPSPRAKQSGSDDAHIQFATTHWSLVRAAGDDNASQALAQLCELYWIPLYAFLRRQGVDADQAQDLTQGFLADLLQRQGFKNLDHREGRFRSFLLASIRNFVRNQWNHDHAQKRGGRLKLLPLDFGEAESRYQYEPADLRTPESEFNRQWAAALLTRVEQKLQKHAEAKGKSKQFEVLRPYLVGTHGAPTYAAAAEQLGMSESAMKVAVHRLRQQFRRYLREEIAETVTSAEEIDDEIAELFEALRS